MYQIDFEVQIHIEKTHQIHDNLTDAQETPESSTKTLVLSPSQMTARSKQDGIQVEMIGDFASYAELESLRDHWLMIPIQPGLSPNEIFSSNLNMWMVFPPSLVSTIGECDKIGVSYTSFKFQSDRCSRPFESCLSNQIYHYQLEDQLRLSKGLKPLYNIQRFGGGQANQGQLRELSSGLSLKLPLKQMRTSLIQVSIKADGFRYVRNVGHGVIVEASICNFAGTKCGEFEAISENGYIEVHVNNTFAEDAMLHVSLINCSSGIMPVLQNSAAVKGLSMRKFTFKIQATTDLALNCSCNIIVSNALAAITDSRIITFSLAQTRYSPQQEQSDIDDKVRCT